MNILEKIKDEEYYTIRDIFKERFFFWYKDYGSIRRSVLRDMEGKNILKPILIPNRKRNFYKIKGENIKKYITEVAHGNI